MTTPSEFDFRWFSPMGISVFLFILQLANVATLAGWLAVILPFVQKRIPLGFDMPPVVLIMAAVVLPIAAILGWIGLR